MSVFQFTMYSQTIRALDGNGKPIQGVTFRWNRPVEGGYYVYTFGPTDADGNFTVNIYTYNATITIDRPSLTGFSFTPSSVTVAPGDTGIFYIANSHYIKGKVSVAGSGVSGIRIILLKSNTTTTWMTTTGSDGSYSILAPDNSSSDYTLSIIPVGDYTYLPEGFENTDFALSSDQSNYNFIANTTGYIFGKISAGSKELLNVILKADGNTDYYSVTDSTGNYKFTIPAGTYNIFPQNSTGGGLGYNFIKSNTPNTPNPVTVSINTSTELNWIATLATNLSISGFIYNGSDKMNGVTVSLYKDNLIRNSAGFT
jgi:hypothetical protein